MFNGDVAFQRLWRRLTHRYPFARTGAPAADAQALFERDAALAYEALKALGDGRDKLDRDQVEAYFAQLLLLPAEAGARPGDVLDALAGLPLAQAWRWFCFGLHRRPGTLGRYLARDDEAAEAAHAALARGASAFDHERVLR